MNIRYVKFKNVIYNLGNNDRLEIKPIPSGEEVDNMRLIELGMERYLIQSRGELRSENINEHTLKNFDNYLSKYVEALRRLT